MKKICLIFLSLSLFLKSYSQEEKKALVIPYVSISNKKSELYIPSVFASGNKDAVAKVLVDSNGHLLAGLVDGSGKFIVKPVYGSFGKAINGFIPLIRHDGRMDFYSVSLKKLLPTDCDHYHMPASNIILLSQQSNWGALYLESNVDKRIPSLYKFIAYDSASHTLQMNTYDTWKVGDNDTEIASSKLFNYDSLYFIDAFNYMFFRNGSAGLGNVETGEGSLSMKGKFSDTNTTPLPGTFLNLQNEKNLINVPEEYREMYEVGIYTIDSSGKISFPFKSSRYSSFAKIDEDFLKVKDKNAFGVINIKGKIIIPPVFDSIRGPFKDDKIFIAYKGKLTSIYDSNGVLLSEPIERPGRIYDFKEGRARFVKNGYIGFIDVRGNVRVAPQYKQIRDFNEGLSAAVLKGKWCFIDKDENIVVQPLYDEVKDYQNGIAPVRKDNEWFFLNQKGERTSVSSYDSVFYNERGKWIVYKKGKKGLVSSSGKELLAARYEYIQDLAENKVIVVKSGKSGVIDYSENFIIPLKYDKVVYDQSIDKFLVMEKGKTETFSLPKDLRKK